MPRVVTAGDSVCALTYFNHNLPQSPKRQRSNALSVSIFRQLLISPDRIIYTLQQNAATVGWGGGCRGAVYC
jgi:hypothetical protein